MAFRKRLSEALRRGLKILDATCPLVKKVHSSAKRHYDAGRHVILIGHSGHAEVEGTLGQLPEGAISVVRNKEDIQNLSISNEIPLAYITQTTLSVAETKQIIEALKLKYPHIIGPKLEIFVMPQETGKSSLPIIFRS